MSLLGGLTSSPRAASQSAKARMKKLPKRSQNEKYRLKYLRLRKAAKATVFVSLMPLGLSPSPRSEFANLSQNRLPNPVSCP